MAARPRRKSNLDLPANLYKADQQGYRYRRPDNGKWFGMGSNKAKAVAAAKKLNSLLMNGNEDLISKVMDQTITFGEFAAYYMTEVIPPRELANNTLIQYKSRIKMFLQCWEKTPVDEVNLRAIDEHLDSLALTASNQARALLIDMLNHAVSKGICPDNQAALTMPKIAKKQRKRHTVEGLAAIRAAAEPWLQNAIDLALMTAQRRSDVLKLKWDDIREGWLYIEQEKTTDSTEDEFEEMTGAGYIRIKIDSEIQALLDKCRSSNIISPFVIHRRPKKITSRQRDIKAHWTAVELDYLSDAFREARKRANPYPKLNVKQQPGFHEIRALSIHLYKQIGKDPQSLAGHANPEMTAAYASGHSTIIWNDVEVGLKLPFKDK